MVASQIRAKARESLSGKWGNAVLLFLCYFLLFYVINFILQFIPVVGSIISFIIDLPMSYGFLVTFIKLKRGEEVKYFGFIEYGFSQFTKLWCIFGYTILKLIVPFILTIVSMFVLVFATTSAFFGIANYGLLFISLIAFISFTVWLSIQGLYYCLTSYILYDNPTMGNKEIVDRSEQLMQGQRWNFFWLGLTFIGWSILSALTFGIGYLWLAPYIIVSMTIFYESLTNKNDIQSDNTQDSNEDNPISTN